MNIINSFIISSTSSTFQVILQLMHYINYLLAYSLNKQTFNKKDAIFLHLIRLVHSWQSSSHLAEQLWTQAQQINHTTKDNSQ